MKISNESPVGKALIGAKKGKTIEVESPAGIIKYKIVKVENSSTKGKASKTTTKKTAAKEEVKETKTTKKTAAKAEAKEEKPAKKTTKKKADK